MFSSTSSSDPNDATVNGGRAAWRRLFVRMAGTAAIAVAAVYAFVALNDPWSALPLTLPLKRVPVTGNQRYTNPALARSPEFDSALFGNSTSLLLRPESLDPEFSARFVNLAILAATPYEISSMMAVFTSAHPSPKVIIAGLDTAWCATGDSFPQLSQQQFPEWMYHGSRWRAYGELLNMFAVQEAGKEFAILTGFKKPEWPLDGRRDYLPPDGQYNAQQAEAHLHAGIGSFIPGGARVGPPDDWRFPALEKLRQHLSALPDATRKIVFFVPFNRHVLAAPGSDGAAVWAECKRRTAGMATGIANLTVADFMRPSPITTRDDNYWDPLHYRVSIANRLAIDLSRAAMGDPSSDYTLLR